MSDKESRTEAATPAHIAKTVSEHGISTSRELATLAGLAAALLVMVALLPVAAGHFETRLAGLLANAGMVDSRAALRDELLKIAAGAMEIILPIAASISLAAILATVLQTGFRPNPSAIKLHFERLSPLIGVTNLFGSRQMAQTGQTILKLFGIGFVLYFVLSVRFDQIGRVLINPASRLPAAIYGAIIAMLGAAVLIQIVIAVADVAIVKTQFATQMRMSLQEVKDEQKETEGDPHVRGRLKALRSLVAKRSLKAAMERTAVVVTNPTHYAVALEYRAGQIEAPKIAAKGVDEQAARIRELAREMHIPLVANPTLARALFRQDVDTEITPQHYKAVAEVIAYVWKLAENRARAQ